MFTGIVTEIGEVEGLAKKSGAFRLKIKCEKTAEGVETGDSVAVNGVCLSVVGKDGGIFFDVVGNTLSGTGLKRLKRGDKVNLENALRQGDKISGHMVTGHVDGERVIRSKTRTPEGWRVDVSTLAGDEKYLVPRGSAAVDGISLTVAGSGKGYFRVFLIPHTLENTILKLKKTGDYVNVEFDMMAKYAKEQKGQGSVTKDLLRSTGFLK
jgi:riboflavin synthase